MNLGASGHTAREGQVGLDPEASCTNIFILRNEERVHFWKYGHEFKYRLSTIGNLGEIDWKKIDLSFF